MAAPRMLGTRWEIELIRAVPSALQGVVSFAAIGAEPIFRPGWDDTQEEQVSEARTYLESIARRLPRDPRVRTTVRLGDPADEIVTQEREGACFGMIGMSTHGHAGPGRWVMGSMAHGVIHRTAVSVLWCVWPRIGA